MILEADEAFLGDALDEPRERLELAAWTIASHSGVHSVYSTTFTPFCVWVTLPSFTRMTMVFHSPTGFTVFGSAAIMS